MYLTEAALRRLASVPRTFVVSTMPRASFSTSVRQQKTPVETAKDALKSVDRAVSDKIVDGIDIASTVGTKVKEAGQEVAQGKTSGKASELSDKAQGGATELSGKAKGKASELSGKAKGMAEETKQKL